MCAGVRDVANLCWKLNAVLTGKLPESVLDTYQAERMPHVKDVTNRAVKTGKLIIQRNPWRAAARNHFFRTASKVPGFTAWLRQHRWLPDARYRKGLLAHNGNGAVGWLIPQPWVVEEKGDAVRLDDVIGGRWVVLHLGPESDWQKWRAAGVPVVKILVPGSVPSADSVVDADGVLTRWLDQRGASVVVVRPDGFVYAGAAEGQPLPPPPAGSRHKGTAMTANTMTERTVRVNGKEIFVAETGTGAPVVLLHGGGPGASGVSNYSRNIEALAQHFRVIVPDMPGYGRSAKGVDRSDPFGYLADHIRGMLDELGIDRAHLVGNSYGGSCALRLALDTPHRVDKLVLMGPGGVGTTRGLPTAGLKSLLAYYGGDGPNLEKLRTFIRSYLVFDGDAVPDELIESRYAASIDPEVLADPPLQRPPDLRTLWRMDFTRDRRLGSLSIPTLVIWGRDDKVNNPSGAAMLAKRMPNADVMMTANTGHWVQWERAELFNAVAAAFLKS